MYNPTKWKDHVTDPKNEYIIERIEGDRYKITPCGEIIERGTLLSAENFNKQEKGLFEALTALNALLQKTMLNEDLMLDLSDIEHYSLSDFIFVTDEFEFNRENFDAGDITMTATIFYDFPDGAKRKNNNYVAIPVITDISLLASSDTENPAECAPPAIYAKNLEEDGFHIIAYKDRFDSRFNSIKAKMLIIGGL